MRQKGAIIGLALLGLLLTSAVGCTSQPGPIYYPYLPKANEMR